MASYLSQVVVGVTICSLISSGLAQTNRRENPCDRRSGHSAHEEYCDRYYDCVGENEVLERNCPNGLVYAGHKSLVDVCGYEHEFQCGDRQKRNPPIATEHCDWLYGIYGHETSCTRYWTCWNGTASELYCIGGLLFNEATHSCDWPEMVQDCQKHPLCTDDPNGNVPLGNSCERYWSCLGGYPRLQRCPATLVFDQRSRRCVIPPTDDCDTPVTEAPEEQDNNRQFSVNQNQRRNRPGANSGTRPLPSDRLASDARDQPEYFEPYDEVSAAEQSASASEFQGLRTRPDTALRRSTAIRDPPPRAN